MNSQSKRFPMLDFALIFDRGINGPLKLSGKIGRDLGTIPSTVIDCRSYLSILLSYLSI